MMGNWSTTYRELCDESNQYLDYPNLVKSVQVGSDIVIADGNFLLQVTEILDEKTIHAKVLNRATIGSRKNCNLPGMFPRYTTFVVFHAVLDLLVLRQRCQTKCLIVLDIMLAFSCLYH